MEDMLRELLREEIRKGEHWRKRRQSERQPVWRQCSRERERCESEAWKEDEKENQRGERGRV